jgi:NTP pyrophosphatase (non-canonical NTP hydrolase)
MNMLLEKIGKSAMLEQTAEECVELAHACLKLARYYRNENKVYGKSEEEMLDNLAEEMADVELCTMELKKGLELYDEFLAQKDKKRARLRKRLEEPNEEIND